MKHDKKLVSQQETTEQQSFTHHETQQRTELEFDSVEEMIRHDSARTPVPPLIAQKLQDSVARLPGRPSGSWWKRFFGG